jgi:hypothetical protein
LVNGEVLYALREWIRIGMMLEWHQHGINLHGPKLGTLGVFSILPTVEFRPDRWTRERLGWESFVNEELRLKSLIPYVSLGLGANAHSSVIVMRLPLKPNHFPPLLHYEWLLDSILQSIRNGRLTRKWLGIGIAERTISMVRRPILMPPH